MTVVLLPPIGLDADTWQGVDAPFEFDTHQFPGFGRPRAAQPYTLADLADEVVAAHRGELHLVGVSMGGMVALNAAVRWPDRVSSLLVACTGPSARPQTMQARAADAENDGMAGVLASTLARWFTPEVLGATPIHPGVSYARDTLLALDPRAFADGWRAIATHDTRAHLSGLHIPVTAVAGGRDTASPLDRSQEIAARVPGGRLVVIEDAPHMIHLERPESFVAVAADHLRRVQAG